MLTVALLLFTARVRAQEPVSNLARGPVFGIKTNLLYDATSTINLGVEFRLSKVLTLDVPVNYNPWTFSDNAKMKHLLVQPELRYWLYEPFNGPFFGVHAIGSLFNAGGDVTGASSIIKGMKDYRYQGWTTGVGVSYGYQWMLSNRFSLEATAGLGVLYLEYNKYDCEKCGRKITKESQYYVGPTKLGLSLVWMLW